MPLNIVRPFISPGIRQHFHNKKHFMRSERLECLTLYNLSWGMLAKRQLAPCLLKRALALLWDQTVLVPACLVEKTSAFIKCSLLLLNIICGFFWFFFNYGMSLVAPKKQLRESPVILMLQSADDPVITAGKIQQHSWSLR